MARFNNVLIPEERECFVLDVSGLVIPESIRAEVFAHPNIRGDVG